MDYILRMFIQRSKLVLAEITALFQTDGIGRLNFVQLPKTILNNHGEGDIVSTCLGLRLTLSTAFLEH